MSKYTTTIRWLIESGFDLGLKEYPIFDEQYRNVLNQKIINHYYFREIGLETAALFKWYLNTRMMEIMPYYNQLYDSTKLEITPLTRMDYTENFDKRQNQKADTTNKLEQTDKYTGDTDTNVTSQEIGSDTPQNMNLDSDITTANNIPASSANVGKSSENQNVISNDVKNANSTANQTVNSTEDYIKTIKGNNASRTDSSMLNEWRSTFINIDAMIIENLSDLFMSVY